MVSLLHWTTALSRSSPDAPACSISALSMRRPSPSPWKSSSTARASSPASPAVGTYLASAASRSDPGVRATRDTAPGATSIRASRAIRAGFGRPEWNRQRNDSADSLA